MSDFDKTLNDMLDERIKTIESPEYEGVPRISKFSLACSFILIGGLLISIIVVYLSL